VPPDHFSETGQRWGNPIYRWDRMAERGYRWWMRRLKRTLSRVDLLRIDHFRGFEAYWSIPSDADTAEHGAWEDGPGAAFFDAVADELGDLPIVAEDLGLITPEVTALREQCGFPGMAVLQFAFEDDAEHKYLPHNFERNVVAYTGTHDNNTLRGWWDEDATGDEKAFARGYLDLARGAPDLCRQTLRMLWASVADRVVVPLQDVLGRGADARMNAPGTTTGNWRWRVAEGALTDDMLDHLATLTETYGRTPPADRSSSDKT
jgi:4-alpha-glucanotransferase